MSLPAIHIIGLNNEAIQACTVEFGTRATCSVCDITSVPRDSAAFVSPANSLGFMDGGIDKPLREMFPGCESRLKAAIRQLGNRTGLGRYYLRVGSAYWQSVGTNTYLISAPTMFLPHDVSTTQNAYWAFLAVLEAASELPVQRLIVPTLCCGWGRMSAAESARQMRRALDDFEVGRRFPREDAPPGFVLQPSRDEEQPANYDTREIGVGPYADGDRIIEGGSGTYPCDGCGDFRDCSCDDDEYRL